MKMHTKESLKEYKKLKSWVQKCPIEEAEEIEDLRLENKRLRNAVQRIETASNLVLETIRE